MTNNRLHTPGLQRIQQVGNEDGIKVLRQEIDDSMRRVRAAKRGQAIHEVSPEHGTRFYLPNHKEYFP